MSTRRHHEREIKYRGCIELLCRPSTASDVAADRRLPQIRVRGDSDMSLWTIVVIILVIALLGGFSGIGGGPFYGTGYYGGGGLGLVIIILVILLLMGRI